MTRLARALACLLLFAAPAAASTWRALDLGELLGRAELAFHGVVTDVRTELRDDEPWTVVDFEITEAFDWPADPEVEPGAPERVTLAFLGGDAGAVRLTVAFMPGFEIGDEVLLLAYDAPYYSPVVGFNQGLWRLDRLGVWRDEQAEILGATDEGELQTGLEGSATAAVTEAFRRALEAR